VSQQNTLVIGFLSVLVNVKFMFSILLDIGSKRFPFPF
jgi:hypothetical protein